MTEKESKLFYYNKKFQDASVFLANKYNRNFSPEFLTSLLGHYFDSSDVHTLLIFHKEIEQINLIDILVDEMESVIAEISFNSDEFDFLLADQIQKAKIKHNGYQWVIHKNDVDPFPSNPHAHEYNLGVKLHLGTGDMYRNGVKVRCLSKKALCELREKITQRGINLSRLV